MESDNKDEKIVKTGLATGTGITGGGLATLALANRLENNLKKLPPKEQARRIKILESEGISIPKSKKIGKITTGIGAGVLGLTAYQHYKNKNKNKNVNPEK